VPEIRSGDALPSASSENAVTTSTSVRAARFVAENIRSSRSAMSAPGPGPVVDPAEGRRAVVLIGQPCGFVPGHHQPLRAGLLRSPGVVACERDRISVAVALSGGRQRRSLPCHQPGGGVPLCQRRSTLNHQLDISSPMPTLSFRSRPPWSSARCSPVGPDGPRARHTVAIAHLGGRGTTASLQASPTR